MARASSSASCPRLPTSGRSPSPNWMRNFRTLRCRLSASEGSSRRYVGTRTSDSTASSQGFDNHHAEENTRPVLSVHPHYFIFHLLSTILQQPSLKRTFFTSISTKRLTFLIIFITSVSNKKSHPPIFSKNIKFPFNSTPNPP